MGALCNSGRGVKKDVDVVGSMENSQSACVEYFRKAKRLCDNIEHCQPAVDSGFRGFEKPDSE